jgi:hypothetical protein
MAWLLSYEAVQINIIKTLILTKNNRYETFKKTN